MPFFFDYATNISNYLITYKYLSKKIAWMYSVISIHPVASHEQGEDTRYRSYRGYCRCDYPFKVNRVAQIWVLCHVSLTLRGYTRGFQIMPLSPCPLSQPFHFKPFHARYKHMTRISVRATAPADQQPQHRLFLLA